ncbi:MAG: hypothetical protein JWM10_5125 [Myxococcaceae bacterium]|nr:hypothetical protein [Myxococcaceae bacterium]
MKLRGRPVPTRRAIAPHRSPAGQVAAMALVIVGLVVGAFYTYARLEGWDLQFKHPWLLLALPGALLVYVCSRLLWKRAGAVPGEALTRLKVSQGAALRSVPRTLSARLIHLPGALRVSAIVLVGLALARPQRVDAPDALELSGIDIVMSIDLSGSMRAADLQPTRLEAAKEVVGDFIQRRRSDRMGLVVFGREAFTVVPPTLDYTVLQRMVSALSLDLIDGSGTAIGDGLGTALNRLRHSDARSKVVVLLTDGANNAGHVDPREAAQLATALRVKVYTILVGTAEEAPVQQGVDLAGRPVYATARFPVDPQLLQDIATTTGGQFFRAVDRAGLAQSFHTILDQLERSKIADAGARYAELYPVLVAAALALLALEVLLASTRLRRFP